MKLPNWLHRKPNNPWSWLDVPLNHYANVPPADPYLNSLGATPTFAAKGQYEAELDKSGHVPGEYAPSLKDPWDAAFYERKESVEGAHARGYWEGRAEADAQAANPEYHVEVVRYDDASIDEVLLHDATRCLVHLERLDTDHWWITLSPTGGWNEEESFDIFRVKKCIEVTEQ